MNPPLKPRPIQISQPAMDGEEWSAVGEVLESGWLTQGPKVAKFEQAFAARHGAKHGLAVTSCTTGLHLALTALGIGSGDEVIVPAFGWIAVANVVIYCGATPVFADVDVSTFNVTPAEIARRLTPRTKAIIVVHHFGLCADMAAIRGGLPKGVHVIEDAACAAGAVHGGVSAGSLGDVAVFSLHPRKAITTGEGGVITTNNPDLAAKMDRLRNHGASVSEEARHRGPAPHLLPDFDELGFNYRMTDLQAAVGIVQLRKLDGFLAARRRWAGWYAERLKDVAWLRLPQEPKDGAHGWQAFVTYVDPGRAPAPRNVLMERLQASGIATRPGSHAIHMLGYYRERFGLRPDDYPGARDSAEQSMAIPLHNRMDEADYERVAAALEAL